MRAIKSECRTSGPISLSASEANRGYYTCPECRRTLNLRVRLDDDGWPIGTIPRHSTIGPKDMTVIKRRKTI